MHIAEVMDRDLTAVSLDATVGEVVEILSRHRLSELPVVDDEGRVKGFVSDRDIVRAALPGYFEYLKDASFIPDFGQFQARLRRVSREPVSKYMVADVECFEENDSDFSVAMALIRTDRRRAPIVRDGILVGIANRTDLLDRLLEEERERARA